MTTKQSSHGYIEFITGSTQYITIEFQFFESWIDGRFGIVSGELVRFLGELIHSSFGDVKEKQKTKTKTKRVEKNTTNNEKRKVHIDHQTG